VVGQGAMIVSQACRDFQRFGQDTKRNYFFEHKVIIDNGLQTGYNGRDL
jgi:hypothetical protein